MLATLWCGARPTPLAPSVAAFAGGLTSETHVSRPPTDASADSGRIFTPGPGAAVRLGTTPSHARAWLEGRRVSRRAARSWSRSARRARPGPPDGLGGSRSRAAGAAGRAGGSMPSSRRCSGPAPRLSRRPVCPPGRTTAAGSALLLSDADPCCARRTGLRAVRWTRLGGRSYQSGSDIAFARCGVSCPGSGSVRTPVTGSLTPRRAMADPARAGAGALHGRPGTRLGRSGGSTSRVGGGGGGLGTDNRVGGTPCSGSPGTVVALTH